MSKVFIGTELKLNVSIDPIDGVSMEDYDFGIELICGTFQKKSIVFDKDQCVKVDSNNYLLCFNTEDIGTGNLTCRVIANIPDGDFKDGKRTEVTEVNTGIEIIKTT